MKTEILTWCDQTLAATANGVYQGILLTLLIALGVRLLGRSNAATRHSIWLATLLLLPAIMAAHYFLDHRSSVDANLPAKSSPPTVSERELVTPAASIASDESVSPSPELQPEPGPEEQAGVARASQRKFKVLEEPPVPWAGRGELEMVMVPQVSNQERAAEPKVSPPARTMPSYPLVADLKRRLCSAVSRLAQPASWNLASGFNVPRLAGLVLVGVWGIVAGLKLILLGWRLRELAKLKRDSVPADVQLTSTFNNLAELVRVGRSVELRVSQVCRSPVVLGFLRPVVLLPAAELLPREPAETEHILRHELAHVRRNDDWTNLLQHVLQAALFFHPGVIWLSRRLVLDREIACDDEVLHLVGKPRAYALTLANLASRIRQSTPTLAPGASTNKSQLQQRISMILDTNRNTSIRLARTRLGLVLSAAAVLSALAIYSAPRLVLAQSAAPSAANTQPTAEPDTAETAPAPSIIVAQNGEAGGTVSVESDNGPRSKPDEPSVPEAVIIAPAVPTPPAPPAAGVPVAVPAVPAAPLIVAAPNALTVAPNPPSGGMAYALMGKGADDGSLEQRLERLERMVHSLMDRQKGMHSAPDHSTPKPNWNFNFDEKLKFDQKQMDRMKEMAERDADRAKAQAEREAGRAKALAEREAERAKVEAKRAAEEAERYAKEMNQATKEKGLGGRDGQAESSKRQLEALRRAKENLERQVERLDSQIEKLEQDQEKMQDEQERRSELKEELESKEAAVAGLETE